MTRTLPFHSPQCAGRGDRVKLATSAREVTPLTKFAAAQSQSYGSGEAILFGAVAECLISDEVLEFRNAPAHFRRIVGITCSHECLKRRFHAMIRRVKRKPIVKNYIGTGFFLGCYRATWRIGDHDLALNT